MSALVRWWRRLPPLGRGATVVVVLVVGLNVLVASIRTFEGGNVSGPPSSSYATTSDGVAAWAKLLARSGHPVRRLREPMTAENLDPRITLILVDPDPSALQRKEADAVRRFVREGGRLVAGGPVALEVAEDTLPGLRYGPGGARSARALAPVPEVDGVGTVEGAGRGALRRAGSALPVLGDDDSVTAAVGRYGAGRVVALADTTPLRNARLAQAGNAAFALRLAGEPDRPVLFAEAGHGYGDDGGPIPLSALPGRWPAALVAAAAATVVWALGRARRFGPPDQPAPEPPPPRRAYVEAMATTLARSRRPREAAQPLQDRARARLIRRLGLAPGADDPETRAAAGRLGLPAEDVEALMLPPTIELSDDALLALGRAAARLEREEGP